jgi:hypothetical protein
MYMGPPLISKLIRDVGRIFSGNWWMVVFHPFYKSFDSTELKLLRYCQKFSREEWVTYCVETLYCER